MPATLARAVLQHDVVCRRFQHMAGDLDQLGAHLARGDQRGAAGDHQRAAGEGAPAVRRAVGIAVHDFDHVGRDADLVGDDLRQRGAQALAVRRGADARLDEAGRIDRDDHRLPAGRDLHAARGKGRAAVAGALGEGRKADAEIAALGARFFLPLAEGRQRRRRQPPSPASVCSWPRRIRGPSRTCREMRRSGCGGGSRPGRRRARPPPCPSAVPARR